MNKNNTTLNDNQTLQVQPTPNTTVITDTDLTQHEAVSDGFNQSSPKPGFFEIKAPTQNFINILLSLNLVTIVIPLLFYAYNYTNGTDDSVLAGVLLIPLTIFFTIPTIIANFIYIPLFLIKSKPTAGYALLAILTLLLPVCIFTGYYFMR